MPVKLTMRDYWYSKEVEMQRKKRAIITALPAVFAGMNMLGGLSILIANSWLGYTRSKAMTYAVEALHKTTGSSTTD